MALLAWVLWLPFLILLDRPLLTLALMYLCIWGMLHFSSRAYANYKRWAE